MKKLFLLIGVMFISVFSIVANETNVEIQTNVSEVSVEYNLYYQDEASSVANNRIFTVSENSLTDSSITTRVGNFKLKTSCNSNSDLSVSVSVEPGEFKARKNENSNGQGNGAFLHSNITPDVEYLDLEDNSILEGVEEYSYTLNAGCYDDKVVCLFNLLWNGTDDDLTAGTYKSEVTVTYSVS